MWSVNSVGAVLFDLDGTLVDTAQDFINVLNHQRELNNLAPLPAKTIRDTVSDGARALTRLAFGSEPGESEFEQKRRELLELYALKVGDHAALFDGMESVLEYLENNRIHWGIVTNKPRRFTEILLDKLALSDRSAVTVCPDDVTNSKPDPESLILANDKLGVSANRSLYVGDHERDIVAGKAAGMPTIAAEYGYIMAPDSAFKWGADTVIQTPKQLIELIN